MLHLKTGRRFIETPLTRDIDYRLRQIDAVGAAFQCNPTGLPLFRVDPEGSVLKMLCLRCGILNYRLGPLIQRIIFGAKFFRLPQIVRE